MLLIPRTSQITPSSQKNDDGIQWVSLAQMVFCAQATVKRRLKQVARSADLSAVETLLLLTCDDADKGISQQELVRSTGCSAALVSSRIEALQKREFVASQRNPKDRRHQFWLITESGKQLADELLKQLGTGDWEELRELASALANLTASNPETCQSPTDAESDRGLAA